MFRKNPVCPAPGAPHHHHLHQEPPHHPPGEGWILFKKILNNLDIRGRYLKKYKNSDFKMSYQNPKFRNVLPNPQFILNGFSWKFWKIFAPSLPSTQDSSPPPTPRCPSPWSPSPGAPPPTGPGPGWRRGHSSVQVDKHLHLGPFTCTLHLHFTLLTNPGLVVPFPFPYCDSSVSTPKPLKRLKHRVSVREHSLFSNWHSRGVSHIYTCGSRSKLSLAAGGRGLSPTGGQVTRSH